MHVVLALQKLMDRAGERVLAPGAVVAGKYEVERELAVGGIGVVVLARHLELGHRVAIKSLHARFLEDRSIVERFKREARLAASIRSDHVVRVHDVGTLDDGAPFMVMEYLEGEDLGAVVARGPVPVPMAVEWVLQACEALAEAHEKGIVHRDLKPENLFLSRRSTGAIIKELDFGISKATPTNSEEGPLSRMTEEGERFGTPLYMSPEQLVSSSRADVRSDIWALGVVLYELLTAELPFPGEDVSTIIANVLSSTPVPLRVKRPDAGPILDGIVEACLSRDPALRPANIADLTLLLSAVLPDSLHGRRAANTAPEMLATPPLAWVPSAAGPAVPAVTETRLVSARPAKKWALYALGATTVVLLLASLTGIVAWSRDPAAGGIVQSAGSDRASHSTTIEEAVGAAPIVLELPDSSEGAAPEVVRTAAAVDAGAVRVAVPPPAAPPSRRAPARPAPSSGQADYMEFGARR